MNDFKNTLIAICATLFSVTSISAHAESTSHLLPTYKDSMLIIPRVNTETQEKSYQNVVFAFNASSNSWNLIDYTSAPKSQLLKIDDVELILYGETPLQIFLKVAGYFTNGCGAFENASGFLEENKFNVEINTSYVPPDAICAAAIVPFEKTIPLQAYDLKAGTYEYSVNGQHFGSFTLDKDNKF